MGGTHRDGKRQVWHGAAGGLVMLYWRAWWALACVLAGRPVVVHRVVLDYHGHAMLVGTRVAASSKPVAAAAAATAAAAVLLLLLLQLNLPHHPCPAPTCNRAPPFPPKLVAPLGVTAR